PCGGKGQGDRVGRRGSAECSSLVEPGPLPVTGSRIKSGMTALGIADGGGRQPVVSGHPGRRPGIQYAQGSCCISGHPSSPALPPKGRRGADAAARLPCRLSAKLSTLHSTLLPLREKVAAKRSDEGCAAVPSKKGRLFRTGLKLGCASSIWG